MSAAPGREAKTVGNFISVSNNSDSQQQSSRNVNNQNQQIPIQQQQQQVQQNKNDNNSSSTSSSNGFGDIDPEDLSASDFVKRFNFANETDEDANNGDDDNDNVAVDQNMNNGILTYTNRDKQQQYLQDQQKSSNKKRQSQDVYVEQQQDDQEEESSFENFIDQADDFHDGGDSEDDDGDSYDDSNYPGGVSKRSNKRLIPIEFAKKHIQKIEEDMQRMHERHVKLLREMDENYKLIEKETQEYYLEFLTKWKEVARSKITQYRRAIDQLYTESENIKKEKEKQGELLNEKITQLHKDKEKLLTQHNEDIQLRDDEIASLQRQLEDKRRELDRDRSDFKYKLNDRDSKIKEMQMEMQKLKEEHDRREQELEDENSKMRNQFEDRIQDYVNKLNKKIEENQSLVLNNSSLTQKIQSLDQQLQNISVLSSSGGNMSNGNGSGLIQNTTIQQTPNSSSSVPRTFNISQIKGFKTSSKKPNNEQQQQLMTPNQQQQQLTIGKDKVFSLRNNEVNKSQNTPFIYQQQNKLFGGLQQQNDVKIISGNNNYNTEQQQKQPAFTITKIKKDQDNNAIAGGGQVKDAPVKDYNQTQIDNLKKEIEDKTKEYDDKINNLKVKIKEQGDQIKEECKAMGIELKNLVIPKENKQLMELAQNYKNNQKLKNDFMKEKSDALQSLNQKLNDYTAKSNQQNQLQTPQKSARGSKSMSPRQQMLLKLQQQEHQKQLNQLQQQHNLQDDLNINKKQQQQQNTSLNHSVVINESEQKLQNNDQNTQKQLDFIQESANLIKIVDILIQSLESYTSTQVLSEVTILRQKLSQNVNNITPSDIKEQYQKQNQDLQQMIETNNKLSVNLKKFSLLIKNFQEEINLYRKHRQTCNQEGDLSNVNISRISNSDAINQSAISSQQQQSVIMMDEEERQRLRQQFKELEQKAKNGIKVREDKINQLKALNQRIKKDMEDQAQNFNDKIKVLEKRISDLQDVNQNGEAMLLRQIDELKKNQEALQCKYQNEMYQRKMLHNQIEDMKGKIRVFCRVRPLNQSEKEMQCQEIVKVIDGQRIVLPIPNPGINGGFTNLFFDFDSCFDKSTSQEEVFEDVKMLLQSAMDGFNVCIFAYGQTGSGKTFTIQGTDENPGIIPRALQQLYELKKKMEQNHFTIHFECFMVEQYLEGLIDCLYEKQSIKDKAPQLDIREDQGRIFIENVTVLPIQSLEELRQCYFKGLKTRKVSSTKMNDTSSRSHMIFTVQIHTFNEQTRQKTMSKISFVDLAGSERQEKAQGNKERVAEANSINKSLLTLGQVVRDLIKGENHIPYKNSKLTHLMKDSLGGNSKTLMFVNITPSDYNISETRSSIIFGQTAKNIVNNVQKNVESQEVQRLREENDQLKKMLTNTQQHGITASTGMMISQKTNITQKR